MPSADQCTAVDGSGNQQTFNPSTVGTDGPISDTRLDLYAGLIGVSCPSTNQCTAVGGGSEVTFNPATALSPSGGDRRSGTHRQHCQEPFVPVDGPVHRRRRDRQRGHVQPDHGHSR